MLRRHKIDRAQWPRKWNIGGKRWCRRRAAATAAVAIRDLCRRSLDVVRDRVVVAATDPPSNSNSNHRTNRTNSNCRRRRRWARGTRRKCAVSTSRRLSARTATSVSSRTANRTYAPCSDTPSTRPNRAARSTRPVTARTVNGAISCTRETVTSNRRRPPRHRCPRPRRPASVATEARWPTSDWACSTACSRRPSRQRAGYRCSTGCPARRRPPATCSRSTFRPPRSYRRRAALAIPNPILVFTGSERRRPSPIPSITTTTPPPPQSARRPLPHCSNFFFIYNIPKRDNSLVHSLNYITR